MASGQGRARGRGQNSAGKAAGSSSLQRPGGLGLFSTRKSERAWSEDVRHRREPKQLQSSSEMSLFLETEATLSRDVVLFYGLKNFMTLCRNSKITAIDRKEGEGVVVRGTFQAVDELSSQLQTAVSRGSQTVAWNLAFSPNFCATIDHTANTADGNSQDTILSPASNHSDNPDCREPAEITPQLPNSDRFTTGSSINSDNDSVAVGTVADTDKHTSLNLELAKTTWTIITIKLEKRILTVKGKYQVEIKRNPAVADSSVIVTIDGSDAQEVELARAALTEIARDVEKDLTCEEMLWQGSTDISWMRKIQWKDLKTLYSFTFGQNCVVVTGLSNDVRRARSKIKDMLEQNFTETAVAKMVGVFNSNRSILIKKGAAISEKVDVAIIVTALDKLEKKKVEVGIKKSEGLPYRYLVTVCATVSSSYSEKEIQEIVTKVCHEGLQKADEVKAAVVAIEDIGSQLRLSSKDVFIRSQLTAIQTFFEDNPNTSVREVRVVVDKDSLQSFRREANSCFSSTVDCEDSDCAGHSDAFYCLQSGPEGNCPAETRTAKEIQPGTMSYKHLKESLPGHEGVGTIEITYHIPSGYYNGNSAMAYEGLTANAYLPYDREGNELLPLLKTAFDSGLTFAVYPLSLKEVKGFRVWWNGISHKTNQSGGREKNGYPDEEYLQRLRKDLRKKKIGLS